MYLKMTTTSSEPAKNQSGEVVSFDYRIPLYPKSHR